MVVNLDDVARGLEEFGSWTTSLLSHSDAQTPISPACIAFAAPRYQHDETCVQR